jgi:hypothetical protein
LTSTGWREEKYREIFDSAILGLERRRNADPSFTIADAEGTLAHLYIQEGNDWTGRGELQDLILAATIAAYELVIGEWKAGENDAPGAPGGAHGLFRSSFAVYPGNDKE